MVIDMIFGVDKGSIGDPCAYNEFHELDDHFYGHYDNFHEL